VVVEHLTRLGGGVPPEPQPPQPGLVELAVLRLCDEVAALRAEVEALRFDIELLHDHEPGRLSRAWSRVCGWLSPDPDAVIEHDEPEDDTQ
jgi:hypothetical protein